MGGGNRTRSREKGGVELLAEVSRQQTEIIMKEGYRPSDSEKNGEERRSFLERVVLTDSKGV